MQKMSIREGNRLNVTSRWKKIQAKEWQYTKKAVAKHPELKAMILGYLAGDGSISLDDGIRNRHNTLKFFPDHVSLLQPYCEAVQKLYVKKPRIKIFPHYFYLTTGSKNAVLDIKQVARLGVRTWEVPVRALPTEKSKREWLRAFFDCEAYVSKIGFNHELKLSKLEESTKF